MSVQGAAADKSGTIHAGLQLLCEDAHRGVGPLLSALLSGTQSNPEVLKTITGSVRSMINLASDEDARKAFSLDKIPVVPSLVDKPRQRLEWLVLTSLVPLLAVPTLTTIHREYVVRALQVIRVALTLSEDGSVFVVSPNTPSRTQAFDRAIVGVLDDIGKFLGRKDLSFPCDCPIKMSTFRSSTATDIDPVWMVLRFGSLDDAITVICYLISFESQESDSDGWSMYKVDEDLRMQLLAAICALLTTLSPSRIVAKREGSGGQHLAASSASVVQLFYQVCCHCVVHVVPLQNADMRLLSRLAKSLMVILHSHVMTVEARCNEWKAGAANRTSRIKIEGEQGIMDTPTLNLSVKDCRSELPAMAALEDLLAKSLTQVMSCAFDSLSDTAHLQDIRPLVVSLFFSDGLLSLSEDASGLKVQRVIFLMLIRFVPSGAFKDPLRAVNHVLRHFQHLELDILSSMMYAVLEYWRDEGGPDGTPESHTGVESRITVAFGGDLDQAGSSAKRAIGDEQELSIAGILDLKGKRLKRDDPTANPPSIESLSSSIVSYSQPSQRPLRRNHRTSSEDVVMKRTPSTRLLSMLRHLVNAPTFSQTTSQVARGIQPLLSLEGLRSSVIIVQVWSMFTLGEHSTEKGKDVEQLVALVEKIVRHYITWSLSPGMQNASLNEEYLASSYPLMLDLIAPLSMIELRGDLRVLLVCLSSGPWFPRLAKPELWQHTDCTMDVDSIGGEQQLVKAIRGIQEGNEVLTRLEDNSDILQSCQSFESQKAKALRVMSTLPHCPELETWRGEVVLQALKDDQDDQASEGIHQVSPELKTAALAALSVFSTHSPGAKAVVESATSSLNLDEESEETKIMLAFCMGKIACGLANSVRNIGSHSFYDPMSQQLQPRWSCPECGGLPSEMSQPSGSASIIASARLEPKFLNAFRRLIPTCTSVESRLALLGGLYRVFCHTDFVDENQRPLDLRSFDFGKYLLNQLCDSNDAVRRAAATIAEYLSIKTARLLADDPLGQTDLDESLTRMYEAVSRGLTTVSRDHTAAPLMLLRNMLKHLPEDHRCYDNLIFKIIDQAFTEQHCAQSGFWLDQLSMVAVDRGMSNYRLILPQMEYVCTRVIQKLENMQDSWLDDVFYPWTRLGATKFLQQNLSELIPKMIILDKGDLIGRVADKLNEKAGGLCIRQIDHILAAVYLYLNPQDFERSIELLRGLIVQIEEDSDAQARSLGIADLTNLSTSGLLCCLAAELGSEDATKRHQAQEAIKIVEGYAWERMQQEAQGKAVERPTLAMFLRHHVLAIMSEVNSVVLDKGNAFTLKRKAKTLRSLILLVHMLNPIQRFVLSQIFSPLNVALNIPGLRIHSLRSIKGIVSLVEAEQLDTMLAHIIKTIVKYYPQSTSAEQMVALEILEHLIFQKQNGLSHVLPEVGSLPTLPEFAEMNSVLKDFKDQGGGFESQLRRLIKRSGNEDVELAEQALLELTQFLLYRNYELMDLVTTKEQQVDPVLRELIHALLTAIGRSRSSKSPVSRRCVECLGIIGAIDPSKLSSMRMIPAPPKLINFHEAEDAKNFVCEMIEVQLVGKTRSIGDIQSQNHWAYTLQTLLGFCGITKNVLSGKSGPSRLRASSSRQPLFKSPEERWRAFPRHVQEVLELLIDAKYAKSESSEQNPPRGPLFPRENSFKDWVTKWTLALIAKITSRHAKEIFQACKHLVSYDTNTCLYILPHVVVSVLVDGTDQDREEIVGEIGAVLGSGQGWRQDRTDQSATLHQPRSGELNQLASQTVFALYDHITKWIQSTKNLSARASLAKSYTSSVDPSQSQMRPQDVQALGAVQARLTSISNDVIAMAAFRTKAYARALLHYEQYIRDARHSRQNEALLQTMFERHQEIYAHLEEPDGMEGISMMIASDTKAQQLLQCESTGRWREAQTYYELELRMSPGNLEMLAGRYKCLENLALYGASLSCVENAIAEYPDWEQQLTEWRISSAWKSENWESLEVALSRAKHESFEAGLGQLLLDMRRGDVSGFEEHLQQVRSMTIPPLAAASMESYQRAYEQIVRLHMLRELEVAFKSANPPPSEDFAFGLQEGESYVQRVREYQPTLHQRFEAMAPSFRLREQVLMLNRIAFYNICAPDIIGGDERLYLEKSCGQLWLQSARMARQSGSSEVSFSAILQAEVFKNKLATLEMAKYEYIHCGERQAVKTIDLALNNILAVSSQTSAAARGLPSSRLRQASNNANRAPMFNTELTRVQDHVVDVNDMGYIRAKAHLLRTRWKDKSNLVSPNEILEGYRQATVEADRWEKGYYVAGQYYLKLYEGSRRYKNRLPVLSHMTNACRLYGKALTLGPKYLFQALPRLLTFWLELGQQVQLGRSGLSPTLHPNAATEFQNVNKLMQNLASSLPMYMFLSAFPQIISRMCHKNADAFAVLQHIIVSVVLAFPDQAIWQMVSVSRSIVPERKRVCDKILDSVRFQPLIGTSVFEQIKEALDLCDNLILLCMAAVPEKVDKLSLERNFPKVHQHLKENYRLTIPGQSTLWPTIPESSATMSSHKAFKSGMPQITRFLDEVEVMSSLQRPRKITVVGSDGLHYTFLCKPKDDLRKDSKMMEFNGLVNMLLRRNREANRKNLYIRTYAVIPLNEECGLIEWVHNTTPFRHIMQKQYKVNNIAMPTLPDIKRILDHEDHIRMFTRELLPKFPTVFHKWLLEISQEPTAWFQTRLRYTRTTAVMSMVGHIMGLGDRHGENLLFDHRNGDIVHVDFNCLFEQGKTFPKPERVPFRLTQNMVDAMGLSGYDGVYRLACEQALTVFRDNIDSLVSVLEGFLHDPLVEWAKSKRRGQQTQLNPGPTTTAGAAALGIGAGVGAGLAAGPLNTLAGAEGGVIPSAVEESRARLRTRNEQKARADAAAAAAVAVVETADSQQNEKAQAILTVIKRKLNGTENASAYVLSVQGQVEELIQAATGAENLSKMYIGWSAYL
ncbi:serine/threonine-protein kinase M1 [Mortierella claussenii]|nr:serine/threonine-protein kinase M1 [Mortierella claussenii]